ncbi:hypothetical protein CYY_010119 [Polysphondylium violaceum]|uniref:Uncharacterized protein n=1 Tax=Polysphondylium violaceum TaxID=133409 RepID=A0A8J4PKJ9_9MYCE|nr:hypothetical protein CYY_010119 [Polysphondylium violaceum]
MERAQLWSDDGNFHILIDADNQTTLEKLNSSDSDILMDPPIPLCTTKRTTTTTTTSTTSTQTSTPTRKSTVTRTNYKGCNSEIIEWAKKTGLDYIFGGNLKKMEVCVEFYQTLTLT